MFRPFIYGYRSPLKSFFVFMSPSVPCSQFFPRVSLYYQGASVETLIMNTSVVWCFLGIHVLSTKTNNRMRIEIFYELLFVLGRKKHTHT